MKTVVLLVILWLSAIYPAFASTSWEYSVGFSWDYQEKLTSDMFHLSNLAEQHSTYTATLGTTVTLPQNLSLNLLIPFTLSHGNAEHTFWDETIHTIYTAETIGQVGTVQFGVNLKQEITPSLEGQLGVTFSGRQGVSLTVSKLYDPLLVETTVAYLDELWQGQGSVLFAVNRRYALSSTVTLSRQDLLLEHQVISRNSKQRQNELSFYYSLRQSQLGVKWCWRFRLAP